MVNGIFSFSKAVLGTEGANLGYFGQFVYRNISDVSAFAQSQIVSATDKTLAGTCIFGGCS